MVRGIKGTGKECGHCKDEGYRHRCGSCVDGIKGLGNRVWSEGRRVPAKGFN